MRELKIIGVAVCLVLAAISVNAQEKRYELDEAKVAPGFYLAPNGYEFQLPQYGLSITMPPQSYYKVPYLLKHNAYLNTSDHIVSYCLYKFYLNNSYTDFALFGSYSGNMRLKVAELKNNDKNEFLESLKKKKDFRNHRSLRTSLASYTHYSALNEAGEGRAHGYYYLTDDILIEVIAIPRDEQELRKLEDIIKTLRKVDLQNDLDDYLVMLATLQSTVEQENVDLEITKEEEEIEVLYAQELATPIVATQTPSPFAEPIPGNSSNTNNAQAAKNTAELAAMLRGSYGSKQEEEEKIEVVAVPITEATELVVFKDGFIKPPIVEWEFNIQPQQIPAHNLLATRQKSERVIDSHLFPIYPVTKRPDVHMEDINVSKPSITLASNSYLNTSTATADKTLISTITTVVKKPDVTVEVGDIDAAPLPTVVTRGNFITGDAENSLLAITPVEKRPDVSIDVDVPQTTGLPITTTSLNTSTATAEKTLISSITTVVKKPDVTVEVDNIESTPIHPITSSNNFAPSDIDNSLLAITPVEKRPDVSIDINVSATQALPVSNTTLNTSTTTAERTLISSITPVEKQPAESRIKIDEKTASAAVGMINPTNQPVTNAPDNTPAADAQSTSSPVVYIVTEDIAEEYWNKTQEATTVHQPKFINLLEPPVVDEQRERKRPQATIVDKVEYSDLSQVSSQTEVVNFGGNNKTTRTNEEPATVEEVTDKASISVQEVIKEPSKRKRCSRTEDKIILTNISESVIPYSRVQQKPTFNGGNYNDYALWIGDNMCYPEGLRQELNGYVTVEIVISNDGSIGNVNVMSSPHKLLETEVLYMLATAPKWTPGMQDGKPVAVSVVIGVPISAYL